MSIAERLQDLARRIDRNLPRRDDPERFHAEKSEIAAELRKAAKEVDNVTAR